jgi:hypothetical protein
MGPDALDFWIGEWDCTWQEGGGRNSVTRELGDAVVVERFEAVTPEHFTGMSVSVHDRETGIWRQTWVDSNGSYWHFVGDADNGTVTFATPEPVDADHAFKRMVFSDITADAFRWRWEASSDGATWTERWAIEYRRHGSA